MAKLFFVGDSITAGAWDEKGGWANRLIGQIMRETIASGFTEGGFYCLPYNLGVSGNTIADILPRLKNEITARLDSAPLNEAVEIVFSIGVNDSAYMPIEDKPRFSDREFQDNFETLMMLAQGLAQRVSCIGLLPVNDALLDPVPWSPEYAYRCADIKRFETLIASACQKQTLRFLPLFDIWRAMPGYKDFLMDGIHPNGKGHALLVEQIGDFLITDEFRAFHSGS